MAWNITGNWLASCSCKATCPCNLGPAEPDQGWCSAVAALEIEQGDSDGVNLNDVKAAVLFDLPGDFFGGIDAARLYIDDSCTDQQRRELEAIVHGEKGGAWEAVGAMIKEWRSTEVAPINIQRGESLVITVGDVGRISLQPIKTEDGQPTKLVNSVVPLGFGIESLDLARGDGSSWNDSEMRQWTSLGHGELTTFRWSA